MPRNTPGNPPDKAEFLPHIVETWLNNYEAAKDAERNAEERSGALIWASDAGSCSRRLHYDIRTRKGELEPSNPFTIADRYRFALGNLLHGVLEESIAEAFPGSEAEVRGMFDVPSLSFRADAVIRGTEHGLVVGEWKSSGGYGYQKMTGAKGTADGPRLGAFMQGAISAHKMNADLLVVGYLSTECLSPAVARKNNRTEAERFCAEWHYGPDVFNPVAVAELHRLGEVLRQTDVGEDVPRWTPDLPVGAEITHPATGLWSLVDGGHITMSGTYPLCAGYCSHHATCMADREAGR